MCFGTEDRSSELGFIPKKDDIYSLIEFKSDEINGLQIIKKPVFNDPAIINMQTAPVEPQQEKILPSEILNNASREQIVNVCLYLESTKCITRSS